MSEAPAHPDAALQATALRYAAGDLGDAEVVEFEARLAADQDARDALSEAVRLSAAALGQAPPEPHRSFRAAIRERLAGWCSSWLARRAYRGHPLAWLCLGAVAVTACTVLGVTLAGRQHASGSAALTPVAPPWPTTPAPPTDDPDELLVAEIWADLSTPDHVEKTHDEEVRWRQHLKDLTEHHVGHAPPAAGRPDIRPQ